jgi:hypothetical protein
MKIGSSEETHLAYFRSETKIFPIIATRIGSIGTILCENHSNDNNDYISPLASKLLKIYPIPFICNDHTEIKFALVR